MSQNKDATGTYGSGAAKNANTSTYDSNLSGTYSYSELRKTDFKSKRHGIGVGDKLYLQGLTVTVIEIISEGTGEAVIYKVENDQRKALALKLYFEFSDLKEEPNGETLKRIKEITDPDILKLHHFGVGADKYQGKYCFEVSEYAEGGDLFSVGDLKAHYTPHHIEHTIVPEIFNGIKKLHSYKIFHCDLKPSNIFYLDDNRTDVVIGDYGSGKAFDLETEKDARKTSTVKGTEAYLSPEQTRGIISEKNDYYSFGIILLHLLYPQSIASDPDFQRVNKEKFERIVERQYSSMPIIDYEPNYSRMNTLIEGLTLLNHLNRWGCVQVERWLNGEEVEVKYKTSESDSIQPVKLGYATIRNSKDFTKILESSPTGYDDLIEDPDTYTTVKSWLDSYRDIPTRKVFDNMVRFYQPLGKEYVTEAMLRFFEPDKPILVDMHSFNFFKTADLKKELEAYVGKLDEIWRITAPDRLRFHLFQLELSLGQVKNFVREEDSLLVTGLTEKLYSVFGLSQKPFDFRTEIPSQIDSKNEAKTFNQLLKLFYAFNPARSFRDLNNQAITTLEELGLFFANNESAFNNKFLKAEKEYFLETIGKRKLSELEYIPFEFEIFKANAESYLELVDLSFDRKRHYKVSYKYYKSLNKFMAARGLNKDLTSRSEECEIYRTQRIFGATLDSACEKFIHSVREKHSIGVLNDENLSSIKMKFRTESRKRYLYNYSEPIYKRLSGIFPSHFLQPSSLPEMIQREAYFQKTMHWKMAAVAGVASALATLALFFALANFMGWIPLNQNTSYLTFTSAANLDGLRYSDGDYLEVASQAEFATCLKNGTSERCYPTKAASSILRSGHSNMDGVGIDRFGTDDYELRQAKTVFKVTKTANLIVHQFPVGSVADVTLDDGRQLCFKYGKKRHCFPRRVQCRGSCPDMIDDYGYVINNYRGRRLFTFSQAATVDSLTFPKGSSWEINRDSNWATCIATPGGPNTRCFLKEAAIKRFSQPNVPVVTDYGNIGPRTMTISSIGFGFAGLVALLMATFVFLGTARIAKQVKLFFLRGEINTLKFKTM